MDLGISGKKALVMASSKGIGRAIAEALIKEGVTTAICARNKEQLELTANEIQATPFQIDLSKKDAGANLVSMVKEQLGTIDIFIVNSGGPPLTTFETTTDEQWRDSFESLWMTNIDALRVCLPDMQKNNWGRVIFITSIAAVEPVPNLILSNSLRAGLHGLVNSLSKEYAQDGISVNAIMPGTVKTERLLSGFQKHKGMLESFLQLIPAKRFGEPEEIAALAAFLCSDIAGYITGQAITFDGGMRRSI